MNVDERQMGREREATAVTRLEWSSRRMRSRVFDGNPFMRTRGAPEVLSHQSAAASRTRLPCERSASLESARFIRDSI
jgi:hypothetical protein